MENDTRLALVIDDDEIICDVVEAFLFRKGGYNVHVAYDGVKGSEKAKVVAYDVIFTDIVMPGKEGIGFLREVKREQHNLKVVAMSGAESKEEYLDTAIKFGADAVLTKPFTYTQFCDVLEQLGL